MRIQYFFLMASLSATLSASTISTPLESAITTADNALATHGETLTSLENDINSLEAQLQDKRREHIKLSRAHDDVQKQLLTAQRLQLEIYHKQEKIEDAQEAQEDKAEATEDKNVTNALLDALKAQGVNVAPVTNHPSAKTNVTQYQESYAPAQAAPMDQRPYAAAPADTHAQTYGQPFATPQQHAQAIDPRADDVETTPKGSYATQSVPFSGADYPQEKADISSQQPMSFQQALQSGVITAPRS